MVDISVNTDIKNVDLEIILNLRSEAQHTI